jgi:hypothetical protein
MSSTLNGQQIIELTNLRQSVIDSNENYHFLYQ